NNRSWVIHKLAAQNILTVNGHPVEQQTVISNGDEIGLASTTFLLSQLPTPPHSSEDVTAEKIQSPPPLPIYNGTLPMGPILEVSTNINADKRIYPLNKPPINIGSDSSNDIPINVRFVSNFHAQIVREDGQLLLVYPHPREQR